MNPNVTNAKTIEIVFIPTYTSLQALSKLAATGNLYKMCLTCKRGGALQTRCPLWFMVRFSVLHVYSDNPSSKGHHL
jgi:hypothetical protein